MEKLKNILFDLCSAGGVSGSEADVVSVCEKYLPKNAELITDKNSNVFIITGNKDGKRTLMLDAHLDVIGLRVTSVLKEGFLRFDRCGGVDRRVLSGSAVTVHGKEKLGGIITCTPPHLSDGGEDKAPKLSELLIDCGLKGKKLEQAVSVGDSVTVNAEPCMLLNNRVTASGTDNRSCAAVLLYLAKLISEVKTDLRVVIALTSREELNALGAKTAAFSIAPDECISLDVSFAAQAESIDYPTPGKLGGGAMLCRTPSLDRAFADRLEAVAEKNNIPYQIEVCAGRTGTNADHISVTGSGIKTALLSLPQRYMHTQAEVVDLADMKNTAELILEYIKEEAYEA